MKHIAIVCSGHIRSFDKCYPTWTRENLRLDEDIHIQYFSIYWDEGKKPEFGDPVIYRSLSFIEYKETFDKQKDELLDLTRKKPSFDFPERTFSKDYLRLIAYEELVKYEELHNIQFDYVIYIRYDTCIVSPLPEDIYNENILFYPEYLSYGIFSDVLVILPRKYTEAFLCTYHFITEVHTTKNTTPDRICPHETLKLIMDKHHVQTKCRNFNITIIRE